MKLLMGLTTVIAVVWVVGPTVIAMPGCTSVTVVLSFGLSVDHFTATASISEAWFGFARH